jgi:hypothetical protein
MLDRAIVVGGAVIVGTPRDHTIVGAAIVDHAGRVIDAFAGMPVPYLT